MSDESEELVMQFVALRQMLLQLPDTIAQLLISQLDIVIDALAKRDLIVTKQVTSQLEDIRLNIKTMEFDLESTKAEKLVLQRRLKEAGLE